jgi:hypothetical protein
MTRLIPGFAVSRLTAGVAASIALILTGCTGMAQT